MEPTDIGAKAAGWFWQPPLSVRFPTYAVGFLPRFQQLYSGADQFRQIVHVQCVLELGADIDHGLVADIQLAGDVALRLALGQERERLRLPRR
jgi:hypothetical protein